MILGAIKAGYAKISGALNRSGARLRGAISSLFAKGAIDEAMVERLEQLFYEADFGVTFAAELAARVKEAVRRRPELGAEELLEELQRDCIGELERCFPAIHWAAEGPTVAAIVGVNGNGKTTSCAKIAKRWSDEGKKVLLAAADTYRAAAVEQLDLWAAQLKLPIVKGTSGSDPSAVAFDALTAAKARGCDAVILDTAGRLHTKSSLMQELEKFCRTCRKVIPSAPHETLLVIDANNGQNGIDQAMTFHRHCPLSGLIVTKLDSGAKGGIIFQIQRQLAVPVKFIGVGEGADDLQPFDPTSFCRALLS